MGGGAGKISLSVEAGGDDGETTKADTSGGTGGKSDTICIGDVSCRIIEAEHRTENQYFKQLRAEQLKSLQKHHDDEIEAHEREINRHRQSINRLKRLRSEVSEAASGSDVG